MRLSACVASVLWVSTVVSDDQVEEGKGAVQRSLESKEGRKEDVRAYMKELGVSGTVFLFPFFHCFCLFLFYHRISIIDPRLCVLLVEQLR